MSEERKVQSDEIINRTPIDLPKFQKGSTLQWQINFFQGRDQAQAHEENSKNKGKKDKNQTVKSS